MLTWDALNGSNRCSMNAERAVDQQIMWSVDHASLSRSALRSLST